VSILNKLGVRFPIIQAPMAGVSTPELAAAVSNAGGLGSIGVGATDASGARAMIDALKQLTDRPFNVNLFVHKDPVRNPEREERWLGGLASEFARFDARPPEHLQTIYTSFASDPDMLDMLVETRPPIVSFHFGTPGADQIAALKAAGCTLLATATNLDEGLELQAAGMDAIIAQGIEAGGHRGVFDPAKPDPALGTLALTRLLAARLDVPIIAAGGIMDGRGIAAALALGAEVAQLGTAFIACPESAADATYRDTLLSDRALHTEMTSAISGRPARCMVNQFTTWGHAHRDLAPPDYPVAYDAGKALNKAAKKKGVHTFGAQWAGQGAPLARAMPAAELVETLAREWEAESRSQSIVGSP